MRTYTSDRALEFHGASFAQRATSILRSIPQMTSRSDAWSRSAVFTPARGTAINAMCTPAMSVEPTRVATPDPVHGRWIYQVGFVAPGVCRHRAAANALVICFAVDAFRSGAFR